MTHFVQPEKIEIDANERAVNEKSPYCFFVCTTFDSFLNDFKNFIKEIKDDAVAKRIRGKYDSFYKDDIEAAKYAKAKKIIKK